MKIEITHHPMELPDGDVMIHVIAQDTESRAHVVVRFDKSTGPKVISIAARDCTLPQLSIMIDAIKEYEYEA